MTTAVPSCAALVVAVALGACAGGAEGEGEGEGEGELQFLAQLDEESDIDALVGADGNVKFLAQVEGAAVTPPILEPCEMQNTALYPLHLPFLNAQPGGEDIGINEYTAAVILRATRVWWGGDIAWFPQAPHPITGAPGVLAWHLYTQDSDGNRLTVDDVVAGNARLAGCATGFFEDKLVWSPLTNEQIATTRLHEDELTAQGIGVILP